MKKLVKRVSLLIKILIVSIIIIIAIRETADFLYKATVWGRNKKLFDVSDERIEEETKYYDEMSSKEYESKYNEPFMPDGFTYKEGTVSTGYVIVDQKGNEFVWVPCTNKDLQDVPKLERKNFLELDENIDTRYEETYNEKYKEFINSALMNGGFYISRYELGLENKTLVSKPNVEIANYTKVKFENKIKNMYKDLNCELINSYAYDTTLSWILKNPGNRIYKYDKNTEELKTGRAQINNIYDFQDNIMEITQEKCYDNRVIRGFAYEENIQYWSRYLSVVNQELYFDSYSIVSSRAVIYK